MAKRIYFIGIGGISMSSLAVFFSIKGNIVQGSDIAKAENLKELTSFGIKYNIGHSEKNIKHFNPNLIVINSAIQDDNEELKWAKKKNKKIITRAEALGIISKDFRNVVAVSGTHGKTTTTALISEIFIDAKYKPTVHVGGILKSCGSNFLIGEKKFFITEACEYKNSFLSLTPSLGIVLNIEQDHLDFFKNFSDIQNSFNSFLISSKNKLYRKEDFSYILETRTEKNLFSAKNINKNEKGYYFDFFKNDDFLARIQTNFMGLHNVKNTLVAVIVAYFYKIKMQIIKKSVKNFKGVKRRFERITKIKKTIIIHDYAHHPTEIEKVIEQANRYGRILTVFQPHTFSRTKSLFKEFLLCFNDSNSLVLVKTYPARENEIKGGSALDLFKKLLVYNKNIIKENIYCLKSNTKFRIRNKLNINKLIPKIILNKTTPNRNFVKLRKAYYANNFESAKNYILLNYKKYDCILILGAGDINELAYSLKKYKK